MKKDYLVWFILAWTIIGLLFIVYEWALEIGNPGAAFSTIYALLVIWLCASVLKSKKRKR